VSRELSNAQSAEAEQLVQQRDELNEHRKQAFEALGSNSRLNVREVVALCDKVIDAAKKDLEGE
jgi:hypothetical protein